MSFDWCIKWGPLVFNVEFNRECKDKDTINKR